MIPIPSNENSRLETLYSYNILDTDADSRFDQITNLVSEIFDCPIVLVSLVDKERQWFKSSVGLHCQETPRKISFCGHAIMKSEVMVVEDALTDSRFQNNPLVLDDPKIRFYAGAPLIINDDVRLGTLCLIDTNPRILSPQEQNKLVQFANIVVAAMDQHLTSIKLSEALVRSQSANIAKSQFLSMMSHELRTPLNSIVGFSEIMENQLFGPLGSDRYIEYIQYIKDSGMHLCEIVDDLLDISKIEAGKINTMIDQVDVNMKIIDIIDLVKYKADERNQAIRLKMLNDPNQKLLAVADIRYLRQSLLNLLGNAIKYTQMGGKIQISTSLSSDGEFVIIKISDNGPGIDADNLKKLGDPFFRISVLENDSIIPGTGLGINITKKLLNLMGGSLTFESQLGKGTTAIVKLKTYTE